MSVGFNISSREFLATGDLAEPLDPDAFVSLLDKLNLSRHGVIGHWEDGGFIAQIEKSGRPLGELSFGPRQGFSWKADLEQTAIESIARWLIAELGGDEVWLWSDNGDHAVPLTRDSVAGEVAEMLSGVRRQAHTLPWSDT